MRIFTFLTFLFLPYLAFSQNGAIGIGTENPNSKSILEIYSTEKGLLIPRLTEVQRDILQTAGTANSSINGLLVYNNTTNKFNVWNEDKWEELSTGAGIVGPVGPSGAQWYNGTSSPPTIASEPAGSREGDLYLNNSTGAVYKKQSGGSWLTIANLTTGIVGPAGPQGAAGAQGLKGDQGDVGATGPQGAVGLPGPIGPAGPIGATGAQGDVGAQGVAGPQGLKGDQGDVGPAGPQGAQGLKGDQGDAGPAGPTGATGPIGLTGPAGAQGPLGLPGEPGEQGPAGPQGPSGSTTGWLRTGNGVGKQGGPTTPGVNNDFVGTTDDVELVIAANRTEAIRIATDGKVRIGVSGSYVSSISKLTHTINLPTIQVNRSYKIDFPFVGAVATSSLAVSPSVELPDGLVIAYARVVSAGLVEVKFFNAGDAVTPVLPVTLHISAVN